MYSQWFPERWSEMGLMWSMMLVRSWPFRVSGRETKGVPNCLARLESKKNVALPWSWLMPGVNILQWIVTGINNQGRDEFIYNNHPISSHYPPALLLKCQMKHFKEQHCSTLHLKQLFIPVRDISLELINACAHCSALPLMQNQRHKFCKAIQRSSYTKL